MGLVLTPTLNALGPIVTESYRTIQLRTKSYRATHFGGSGVSHDTFTYKNLSCDTILASRLGRPLQRERVPCHQRRREVSTCALR